MKKKIIIQTAIVTDHKLILETDESITGLIPSEQILVDSDNSAFIYLLEDQEDYTYIVLAEDLWSYLKTANELKLPVLVKSNQEQIELINFHDELEYILSNIKGNSNYGDEFVTKVEGFFLTV
ncbi:hypothetical protein FB550_114136 [Neobacillus bataviensis]|uniref:UPF0738 protein FB550_114136 n=1 Tax=Neobacillus bataviensis TaxID=220685 RepID=A0A561CRR2_9BACI|nr:hypothetical protein [Neobacillus bataviensis]TWD93697.1 hypothetical protein FB550_114136 [Neobacillus bataviensis]